MRPESLDDDDAPAATFVDTVEALDAMIAHIIGSDKGGNTSSGSSDEEEGGVGGRRGSGTRRACREIAVDLEAHSVRYGEHLLRVWTGLPTSVRQDEGSVASDAISSPHTACFSCLFIFSFAVCMKLTACSTVR